MNKININKGLKLSKEAVTKLQDSQLANLKGGAGEKAPAKSCLLLSCDKASEQSIER
ncbi:class I lanthipeptide [Tenacibaculum litopenaei]|uniref:class I lanthipeptide n=1 Tax=Tenacibaculum litopenaei TaxID=396016 RepID=UPI0038B5CEF8